MLEKTEGAPVRLIETHISWLFIAGALAYKLKKPVHLPFLDFRTLASRRHFCEEELRLNLRFCARFLPRRCGRARWFGRTVL